MKKCSKSFLNSALNNLFFFATVLLLYGIMGCKSNGVPGKEDVVARFGGEELLREEVDFFTPADTSPDDSTRYADQYVEKWIKLMAIKEEAENEVGDLSEKMKFKLKQYEYQLIANEFTSWLMDEKGDKEVSEEEIRNHFNKYPEKFISSTNYYQYFYIKTEKSGQYKVVSMMRSSEQEKIDELKAWAKENAIEYRLDSSWVTEPEIDRISDGFYFGNIKRASKRTVYPYSHKEDGKTFYDYYRLIDVIEEGDQLPLSLCRNRIINSILSQTRQTLINQTEANLVKSAKDSRKAQIFK